MLLHMTLKHCGILTRPWQQNTGAHPLHQDGRFIFSLSLCTNVLFFVCTTFFLLELLFLIYVQFVNHLLSAYCLSQCACDVLASTMSHGHHSRASGDNQELDTLPGWWSGHRLAERWNQSSARLSSLSWNCIKREIIFTMSFLCAFIVYYGVVLSLFFN